MFTSSAHSILHRCFPLEIIFTSELLIPNEDLLEEKSSVPEKVLKKIKDIGLFSISIPKEYGGKEFTMEEQVLLTFEFTQASAVFRSIFSTTIGLCSQALLDYGTKQQKDSYLPGMARGDVVGAFALTEPEAGSDAGSLKTTALKKGSGYIINGHKKYITNASFADVFLVMARTDPQSKSGEGVSAFLVDSKKQGIEISLPAKLLGQKGASACEIIFNDVFVSVDDLGGFWSSSELLQAEFICKHNNNDNNKNNLRYLDLKYMILPIGFTKSSMVFIMSKFMLH